MTLKVIHRLQAFSNDIRQTFMQHFTRFQLTACSHGCSALAELLVWCGIMWLVCSIILQVGLYVTSYAIIMFVCVMLGFFFSICLCFIHCICMSHMLLAACAFTDSIWARDCNPGVDFSIPGFAIGKMPILGIPPGLAQYSLQELIIEMRNPNVTWRIILPVYLFTTELRHTCVIP